MKQKNLFSTRGFVFAIVITILAVALIGFYWINKPSDDLNKLSTTSTPISSIVAATTIAPLSPLSPLSPVPTTVTKQTDTAGVEALIQEGIAAYESRNYQEAINILNQALNLDPNNVLAHNARGTVYLDLKEYDKAIADYTGTIELEPLFPYPYYNRGRTYLLLKQYDQAIADLQHATQLLPSEFGYRANGNIGLIYHRQGKYDQALEAFTAAVSFDDSKADTYFLRGETYTAMSNYEAAINDYEAAISRFAKYDQAYQSLGYARYKIGQFDQALEALDKALELSPATPTPYFYRMLVYLATDQTNKTQAEVSQGMDHIGTLPEEEQALLFKRILDDLETFSQENPAQAKAVEALVNLIPPQ